MTDKSDNSSTSSSGNNEESLSETRTAANSRELSNVEKSGSNGGGEGPSASEVGAGHVPADMQASSDGSSSEGSTSSDSNSYED